MWVNQNISGIYCFKTVYYLSLYNSIIFHTTTLFLIAFCPLGYKFLCAPKKMVLVGWQAIQTLFLSLVETLVENESLQSVVEWTKHMIFHRSQMRTKWRMLQHPEVQLPKGGQFADGHFHAKMQHPLLAFLASCSSIWSLPILKHQTVTVTVYCYAPLLVPEMGTCESQKSANTTFCWCYILNFFIYTWSSCLHHATVTSSFHHFCYF